MKNIIGFCLALPLLLSPQLAWAERAQIMLLPTRIVMENSDRYVTVIVKNSGDASGNISIDLVDMVMRENGLVQLMEPGSDPHSAIPYLRISPHSVTLKPQTSQNVRILLRKPQDLPAGEYRSHLKVTIENDNVEASEANKASNTDATGISVKSKLAFTIPVIVRTGETAIAINFDAMKMMRNEQGKPVLNFALLREGNRSVMGDFTITHSKPGRKPDLIKTFPGIPIYRSTDRREVSIGLDDLPGDVDLTTGTLNVVFTAQEKEGGMKLAEGTLDLSAK